LILSSYPLPFVAADYSSLGVFPSLKRRGVCGINQKSRRHRKSRRRGGRSRDAFRETHSETSLVSDHPVRAVFGTYPFLLVARPLLRLRPVGLALRALLRKEGNAPGPESMAKIMLDAS